MEQSRIYGGNLKPWSLKCVRMSDSVAPIAHLVISSAFVFVDTRASTAARPLTNVYTYVDSVSTMNPSLVVLRTFSYLWR